VPHFKKKKLHIAPEGKKTTVITLTYEHRLKFGIILKKTHGRLLLKLRMNPK